MTTDLTQSKKSVQSLLDKLVAALYLRPWIDEAEERHELRKEIVRRVKAGESSLNPLLQLLKHSDWAVRNDVASMLGWIENADAVQPLIEILQKDGSRAVRASAALALERIGTPEAVAAYQAYRDAIMKAIREAEESNEPRG